MKKTVYLNIIIFILVSLLLASTVVYAWFGLTDSIRTQQFGNNVADYGAVMIFEVKKGDDAEYVRIETIDDMHAFFGQTVPSDQITFRIVVENTGNRQVSLTTIVKRLSSQTNDEDFYMLDVFYLKDGVVKVNEDDITFSVDDTPVIKHGQLLNDYRFSNLVDENNNFIMLDNYQLQVDEIILIEFTIVYDENTTLLEYQDGMFIFNSIYVELK